MESTPYLYAHANPYAPVRDNGLQFHGYPQRRSAIKAIVVHCTAGLQGRPREIDLSAENTAAYAAETDRQVSWHSGSDTDSFLTLLPPEAVAFHCRGYNSVTYGHELSKRDMTWTDEDPLWVTSTLSLAAHGLRPIALEHCVPFRQATVAELDLAIATDGPAVGFIGHEPLDPGRRSDPGDDFPWERFLRMAADGDEPIPYQPEEAAMAELVTVDGKTIYAVGYFGVRRVRNPAALEALVYYGYVRNREPRQVSQRWLTDAKALTVAVT